MPLYDYVDLFSKVSFANNSFIFFIVIAQKEVFILGK